MVRAFWLFNIHYSRNIKGIVIFFDTIHTMRWWAFWRRVQYLIAFFVLVFLIGWVLYYIYWNEDPTCSDGLMNGDERGIDCGGSCLIMCLSDVTQPNILWAESFKIVDGQYNAVAYIENRNRTIGTPRLPYTFKLYDDVGLIIEREGVTALPINGVYPLFEGKILTGDRVPTKTKVEFGDDVIWLEGSAGSEQFSLLERNLIGVDSNPRLIARMRNDGLFEAQNIEIVVTIFDSNKRPLTASKTTVGYFAGRSDQDVIFTWPEPIATTLRSCEVPTDVILAIDLSGSMNNDGGTPPEPVTSVLNAAESFVKKLGEKDKSGIVTYATESSLIEQLTSENIRVSEVISNLSISPEEEAGGTNTGDAVKEVREEMSSLRHNENARKVAILLTDGLANAGGDDPETYAVTESERLKDLNVTLFTIGLGSNVNADFLKTLASSNAHYYNASTISQLQSIYNKIKEDICEDGPTVIEVIPKVESSFPQWP